MTLDLGEGRRLVLAAGDDGWIWIAAGAAAILLLLALYRAERRLVPRSTGLALLALRIAAASALAFALLEPIAARSWAERVEGLVIVGVDRSASMETTDSRRPPEESDLLRDAPGLAPPIDEEGGPSRLAVAARILRGEAMAGLDRAHAVEAIGFARSASPALLDDLAAAPGRGAGHENDPGDRLATDWGPVLDRALELGSRGPAPVVGVVLITDGRRNLPDGGDGEAADPIADRLARAGIPVFPVLVGSEVPPRDAAVAAIRAPESSFAGDSATVSVEVKADGFDPEAEIPVLLEIPGREPLREVVRAGPDGSRAVASFRVPLEEPGTVELVAAVEPPGALDGRPENDRRSALVRVGDDPARVLLVDAEARWEFRYLRNALDRDRRATLDAVLLAPPPPSAASEPTFSSEFPPAGSDAPDPLFDYDVIILGDIPPEVAPEGLWQRLSAFVSDRGGTLIVAAGSRSWPDPWLGDESARALLPVLDPAPVPVDPSAVDPDRPAIPPGVLVVPDAEAEAAPDDWPMLQFAADPLASRGAWEGLAPLTWALAGPPKPGATALLVVDRPGTATDPDPDPAAVVAAQAFGLGKVLWVGTDGTWRWRLRVGDAYHHRFWGQALRWAAEAPAPVGNRLVRFGPDRPRVASGSPFPIRARFSADGPDLPPSPLLAARISSSPPAADDQPSAIDYLLPLRPSPSLPRTFEATVPPLPPGRYVAVLDAPALRDAFAAEGLATPEAAFEVAPEPTDELIELAADPAPLARLASITGGRLLRDFEAGQLPDLLASRAVERNRTAELPLWDTPLALALFFALLSAEWALRKRAGLP